VELPDILVRAQGRVRGAEARLEVEEQSLGQRPRPESVWRGPGRTRDLEGGIGGRGTGATSSLHAEW